jgi:hypothetical protein
VSLHPWEWLAQLFAALDVNNLIHEQVRKKVADGISLIIAWQLRFLLLDPLRFLGRRLFSARYRDLRKIQGSYYLYHKPLWNELAQAHPELVAKVRASMLEICVGIRTNRVKQKDVVRNGDTGYAGSVDFKREFIFIQADGVMDRYSGNRKFITLHRPILPTIEKRPFSVKTMFRRNGVSYVGTCGVMVGIANNSNIYRVAVVLSRRSLAPNMVSDLLGYVEGAGATVAASKKVRSEIEAVTNHPFVPNEFDSPFG